METDIFWEVMTESPKAKGNPPESAFGCEASLLWAEFRGVEPEALLRPDAVGELVGDAARVCERALAAARRRLANPVAPLKMLFYGAPGTGKSTIAALVAQELTGGDETALIKVNGRGLHPSWVDEVKGTFATGTLYGGWVVLWIDEVDTCPRDVQDGLLTLMDDMPNCRAVLGTTNHDIDGLSPRFHGRFIVYPVAAVPAVDIEVFLWARWGWGLPRETFREIAEGSEGDVRRALLDTQAHLMAAGAL